MRTLSTLLALAAATLSIAANDKPDFIARQAYASDAQGNAISVSLNDSYYVSTEMDVIGQVTQAYTIRIDTPFTKLVTSPLTFGIGAPGHYRITWGPIPAVTSRNYKVTATIVSSKLTKEITSKNNQASFTFQPVAPSNGTQYSDPKVLRSNMRLWVQFDQAPTSSEIWLPKLESQSFQLALQESNSNLSENVTDEQNAFWAQAVQNPSNEIELQQNWVSQAMRQTSNIEILRTAPYSVPAFLPAEVSQWLQPELWADSANRTIISAAKSFTKKTTNPYDAAEAIYKNVIARTTYFHTAGNNADAVNIYRNRKGDCGGMSNLFVALCRASKIPARTVVGMRTGTNNWHVWAEFYLEGHGWIAVDPSDSDALDPAGKMAHYFGNVPDLNQRVATGFGLDRSWNNRTLPILQSPSAFWSGDIGSSQAELTSSVQLAP